MAITLEQVEKLREKANVSYEEAKAALEQNSGDLLDALIYLERKGKTRSEPGGGGFFTTQPGVQQQSPVSHLPATPPPPRGGYRSTGQGKPSFWSQARELLRAGRNILKHVTVNQFEVWRGGQRMTSMPVLILIILLIVAFYISIPLLIIGLFFGCKYHFSGPSIDRDEDEVSEYEAEVRHGAYEVDAMGRTIDKVVVRINETMETVSETVDGMVEKMNRDLFGKGGKK